MAKKSASVPRLNNLVVVSDLHVGCALGLLGPNGAALDDGGHYAPSPFQKVVYNWWIEFWDVFVPEATKGESFAVVCNGDALDGVHHQATTQWSHNLTIQARAAKDLLAPVVARCAGLYWHIRGTEVHAGTSAQDEERLAAELGAIPNRIGQHARYDLWKLVGPKLVHLSHHIAATSAMQYESTAPHRELVDSFAEAGRWSRRPPDVVVRSHRHRCIDTGMPTASGRSYSVTTPGWQGKTPHVWKGSGRLSEPQFGGIVIRYAHDELFVRSFVKSLAREEAE